jgi:DNA-binding IclR family transcriptional regulator
LAHLERSEIDRILAAKPLTRYTKNTITDPDLLRQDLEKARRQGYAEDNEEIEEGLYCVGAPLFNYSGRPIAAISVSVPKIGAQNVQKDRIIKHVVQAAQEISAKLGYTGRPKTNTIG